MTTTPTITHIIPCYRRIDRWRVDHEGNTWTEPVIAFALTDTGTILPIELIDSVTDPHDLAAIVTTTDDMDLGYYTDGEEPSPRRITTTARRLRDTP